MRSERIDLRVTREEKLAWLEAARADKLKLADWIRGRCNPPVTREPVSLKEPLPKALPMARARKAWHGWRPPRKAKTCKHGREQGYNCGLCGGLAVVE